MPRLRTKSYDELNAWLLDQCVSHARAHRHPEIREQTIWQMFEWSGPARNPLRSHQRAVCISACNFGQPEADYGAVPGPSVLDAFSWNRRRDSTCRAPRSVWRGWSHRSPGSMMRALALWHGDIVRRRVTRGAAGAHAMVLLLARIVGVGIETADMLEEVLWRNFRDRRAVNRNVSSGFFGPGCGESAGRSQGSGSDHARERDDPKLRYARAWSDRDRSAAPDAGWRFSARARCLRVG